MTTRLADTAASVFGAGNDGFNRAELFLRDLDRRILYVLVAVIVIALVVSLRSLMRTPRAPRWRLFLLRATAATLLTFIVLGPSVELQRSTRIPPRAALLVDVSRSMSLGGNGETRIARARAMASRFQQALAGEYEVDLYAFDDELRPLDGTALAGLEAGRGRTDLGGAIASVAARDEDGTLSGIVVVSDGADTRTLGEVADVNRRIVEWGVAPVYPIAVAGANQRDLALVELHHDEFGFVRHEMSFDVRLRARGVDGDEARVVLRTQGAPLQSRVIKVSGDDFTMPLSFAVTPDRPGTVLYSIEVAAVAGEPVVENNRVEFAVRVTRDQVRVLLICGRPSWDERFLRELLKHDPNVDLVSFFILRDTEDQAQVPQDELSLIPFPVNDLFTTELENFDIVILQNLDRRPFLSNLHLDNLRDFVVRRGGGLMLVGGDLGLTSGGYAGSAIEDILPFRLSPGGPAFDESQFAPVLTEAGEHHFITRVEPLLVDTRALWAEQPPLDGANRVGDPQGDAVTLIEHPRLRTGDRAMPILGARDVGEGRTLALAVDSSWYWSFKAVAGGGAGRVYQRFWRGAVRWLVRDPGSRFLQLSVVERTIEPGAPAALTLKAFRNDYMALSAAPVRLTLEFASSGRTGEVATIREDGVTDASGFFAWAPSLSTEGYYRATGELLDARGRLVDRVDDLIQVTSERSEVEDPRVRHDLLQAIADATGGRVLEEDADVVAAMRPREVFRLAERKRVALWDSPWIYAATLLALALEWWFRRRAGLV